MFQWDKSCSYDEQQKRRFHTMARSRLRRLAAELNLLPGSYDLQSNKAGVAVSGEVTLHHGCVYPGQPVRAFLRSRRPVTDVQEPQGLHGRLEPLRRARHA